ncbi:Alpha/beta hydrolase fold-1 [Cladochytrium replicatum]|nr:Alpha/beta hydrolase fold-1 [Cladochytrium replicatum]
MITIDTPKRSEVDPKSWSPEVPATRPIATIQPFEVNGYGSGTRIACSRISLTNVHSHDPATVLLFHHSNGTHKELYYPLITRILSKNPGILCIGLDARNHGDSALLNYTPEGRSRLPSQPHPLLPARTPWIGNTPVREIEPPGDDAFLWWYPAHDVVCVLEFIREQYGASTRVLGFGHSFGGAMLTAAEFLRPGSFAKLYLVEPVIVSAETIWSVEVLTNKDPNKFPHPDSSTWVHSFVGPTRKRKREFADRNEARQYFQSKPFYKVWNKRCLELYLSHGLYETPSGKVALKCHPVQEDETFKGGIPRLFAALPIISVCCKVVSGAESHMVKIPALVDGASGKTKIKDEVIAEQLGAEHKYIPKGVHMVPLQYPDLIGKVKPFVRPITFLMG